ncbi:MAG: ABC transporter ATP-binding protein [Candidatus Schekmanbacteria bacterium RBG_13_48_7]|uniref:ABC transporter ATP-binding protein n=1 Tax=Candidatus Schekmanbacteria bacterium RBG_13_48_7 TaxID=1817878 RepID=A0A1F7S4E7_9BACT|nr:MAG: ABC transporter ATP-binding protein [Candidatus Schekmanbacteria bacterium RBG_13_48_7]
MLEIRGLTKTYDIGFSKVAAVDHINLVVKQGDFLSIMGPSGCGKSTLLYLIGGLLTPTSGEVFIQGKEISRVKDSLRTKIRKEKIGFVFQRFNLLPTLSALSNLELVCQIHGNGHRDGIDAKKMLSVVGLENKMNFKPNQLSMGEQQRVAIARALLMRPSILLADEPTGCLDSKNSDKIMILMKDLNQNMGQTILLITHDPSVASFSDKILKMEDGKIID